ncbi:MAG: vitamin K epoxide reductase family protein [Candidatus Melainabacteria bacterium]|nr:vitamin K epoxide reductase family protein [Candidatus Melainabacteria bacterium]
MRPVYIAAYSLLLVLIINASYLSYKYVNFYWGGNFLESLECADGCDAVMMSQYALLFGIPVPLWGLAYFLVLAAAFWIFTQDKLQPLILDALIVIGLIAATVFVLILYLKLQQICKFCLLSHICTLLFALNYFFGIRETTS